MKSIIVLLLLLPFLAVAEDPSLTPCENPTDGAEQKYLERWRVLADLNGDGTQDMLLSGGPQAFGKSGGFWTVYINTDGSYHAIGDIFAHPKAISIEPDQARFVADSASCRFSRIWVYLRGGGGAGAFGYYRIGKDSVDEMKSLEIYPGDSGTDIGRGIYEAVFKRSVIPYKLQRSKTSERGNVTWNDVTSQ